MGRDSLVSANEPGSVKKPIYVFLFLLVLLAAVLGIFALKKSARRGLTFAAENKKADANKAAEQKAKEPNEVEVRRPDHNHPAFRERIQERRQMVTVYIEKPRWAPDIKDPNVITAMKTVPRHAFVRRSDLRRAYADHPLEIGLGQTISQPYIVAYMTEVLKLRPDCNVLEVGTGSGYQAAVCAEIAREVYTVEILEKLAKSAKERLNKLGYHNVFVKAADGYFGWEEKGPFDAIIVTCAAGFVPPPLVEQLKPGGRMILPRGSPYGSQWLVMVIKDDKGKVSSRRLMPVRFVPMTGRMSKAR